jgi:hypothetical protein
LFTIEAIISQTAKKANSKAGFPPKTCYVMIGNRVITTEPEIHIAAVGIGTNEG